MQAAFYQSESDQPHPGRARAIIKAHPEVRQLMVRNPWTALIAVSIVAMQTASRMEWEGLGSVTGGSVFSSRIALAHSRIMPITSSFTTQLTT
jgi:hypothetical protein